MYIYVFHLFPFQMILFWLMWTLHNRNTFKLRVLPSPPCFFSLYFPSTFHPSFRCLICFPSLSSLLPPLRPSLRRVKWRRRPACQPASICPRPWCRCCWTQSWSRSAWGPFSSLTSMSSSANVSWWGSILIFHSKLLLMCPVQAKNTPKRHESQHDIRCDMLVMWWYVLFVVLSVCQFRASPWVSRRHSPAGLHWSATGKPFHCAHGKFAKYVVLNCVVGLCN